MKLSWSWSSMVVAASWYSVNWLCNCCWSSQHPQIQKKSQYIKYLCCDDVRTLHQWINGIRIAKVSRPPKKEINKIKDFGHTVNVCLCAVWKAAVCELPGSDEEDRGRLRLVLSFHIQHSIRLQFRQYSRLVSITLIPPIDHKWEPPPLAFQTGSACLFRDAQTP